MDLKAQIREAKLKAGEHEEKLGPKPKTQEAKTDKLVSTLRKKTPSTSTDNNPPPPPKPKGPPKGQGR